MTETSFRDLFVELPRAVFESLQAIGEAAVTRAQATTVTPPRSTFGWLASTGRVLAEYYGWLEVIRTERDPLDHYITLVVRLDCLHAQRYRFDELSMLRAGTQASMIDLVCEVIEHTERHCQCVQRGRAD